MSYRLTARHKNVTKTSQRKARKLFVRSRKRVIRFSLLAANLALLGAVVFFVTKAPVKRSVQFSAAASPIAQDVIAGPLDQVSSADIAVHIARAAGLPETVEVTNNADSIAVAAAAPASDASVVAKPQVVSSSLPTYKDIQVYATVSGDTINAIAAKFGVTSDSVRWSNGLSGNTVSAGRTLYLPPAGTNGVVYTVLANDSPEGLAQRYATDKDLIISFNDAEVSGLKVGQRILIPNGIVQAAPVRSTAARTSSYIGFAWGSGAIYGRNGYSYGYCTYYVASRIAVPANWGNADTWPGGARASGWTVSKTPRAGAVAQGAPIFMHVAYVEEVSPDGAMIKYSDMNNLSGWNRVGYSDWVPASYFPNYIYP